VLVAVDARRRVFLLVQERQVEIAERHRDELDAIERLADTLGRR